MAKKAKTVIAVVLCAVGLLWLLPVGFAVRSAYTVTDFEKLRDTEYDTFYTLTVSYKRGEKNESATLESAYPQGWYPTKGEQAVCYYYPFIKDKVFEGDPPSPVSPLVLIALGAAVYLARKPKFLRKQIKEIHDEQK